MAKVAKILLTWNPSISSDVTSQKLVVVVNGEPSLDLELPATASDLIITAPEKTYVHIELTAFDGTFYSEPATLDFAIEDLTNPAPPTGFSYEIIEIIDGDGVDVDDHPTGSGL